MDNVADETDTAAVIGRKLLRYFCLEEDGAFNSFLPGIQVTMAFLNETHERGGGLDEWGRRYQDVKELVENRPTDKAIENWIAAAFGGPC